MTISYEKYISDIEASNDAYCKNHRLEVGEKRNEDDFDCIECLGAKTCKFNPLR